jgi:hypothetical protein
VIDFLFANVVQAKKITAGMIDVASLNGVTLTGTIVQTAATGKRTVLSGTSIKFVADNEVQGGSISATANGSARAWMTLADGQGLYSLRIGPYDLPVSGTVGVQTDGAYIGQLWVDRVLASGTNAEIGGDTGWLNLAGVGGTVQYRRLNGVVYLQGSTTPTASNQTQFTLPVGFRPIGTINTWVDRAGVQQRCRILNNGVCQVFTLAGTSGAIGWGEFPSFPADL